MKQTISVLVENQAGALNRITGLFSRRAFNIESLAVGVTDDPTISRITIIVDSGNSVVEQVEKQLNKLIEVIKVRTLEENASHRPGADAPEGQRQQQDPPGYYDHLRDHGGQGDGHLSHLPHPGAVRHSRPAGHLPVHDAPLLHFGGGPHRHGRRAEGRGKNLIPHS